MEQKEIPGAEPIKPRVYYKEHQCRSRQGGLTTRKTIVTMREGIDPAFFVGECSVCGERIIERPNLF